jgi:hypothetical protein
MRLAHFALALEVGIFVLAAQQFFSCTSPDITTPSPGYSGPTVPLYPASCCKMNLLAILDIFCKNPKLFFQPFVLSILSHI